MPRSWYMGACCMVVWTRWTWALEAQLGVGRVAVITGGGAGLGRAAALKCADRGMKICVADVDESSLEATAQELRERVGEENVYDAVVDVSDAVAVAAFADEVWDRFGDVGFLMNNAGTGVGSASVLENLESFRQCVDVNLFGVTHCLQSFVPRMIDAEKPAFVVNTGSKQGFTTPPGNLAYNAAKAGVKIVTEGLQHELRGRESKVTAHLFVPGFVNTNLARNYFKAIQGDDFDEASVPWAEDKPAKGAWMPQQAIDYLFDALEHGRFYVITPDNDVTVDMDKKRMRWALDDILDRDVPLSRWHPDWKDAFAEYMAADDGSDE